MYHGTLSMYHGTLTMYHGTSALYHGTFSYGNTMKRRCRFFDAHRDMNASFINSKELVSDLDRMNVSLIAGMIV